ncbi:MAG: ABC transporter ATP-binding protein [Planctomycetota bacterium]
MLQLSEVCKRFPGPRGGADVEVLRGACLRLDAGEALVIVGPSGSGKSTLLNIAGLLDPPTSGAVRFGGRDLARLDEPARARHRNEEVGFIFQAHHLLPQLTALENVLLPTLARGTGRSADPSPGDPTERARTLLERVGLGGRLHHRPGELSGGECQRVAVCRALVNRPRLLLADEPTGSLDRAASEALMTLLDELNREEGTALIVVTHAPSVVGRFARVLELRDGVLGALAPVAVEPLSVEPTS